MFLQIWAACIWYIAISIKLCLAVVCFCSQMGQKTVGVQSQRLCVCNFSSIDLKPSTYFAKVLLRLLKVTAFSLQDIYIPNIKLNFLGEGWRSWQKISVQYTIRYYCFIFVTRKNNHYLFVVFPSRLFYATLLLNFFSKSWHKSTFLAFSPALCSIAIYNFGGVLL